MGTFRRIFLGSMAMACAHPALAQDGSAQRSDAPPALQDFRLDPTRDPNRATTPQRAGPEIDNRPAITLPAAPAVTATAPPPAVTPTINPTPPRTRARPQNRTGAETAPASNVTPPQQASVAAPDADAPSTTPPVSAPSASASEEAAPQSSPVVPTSQSAAKWWPWIIGGLVIAAVLAFLFARRRRHDSDDMENAIAPVLTPSIAQPSPPARPRPATPPPPARMAPPPAPVVAAYPVSLHFTALAVRTTLAGAQIAYRLALRNDGGGVIEGLAVAAFIANADARQPQALAAFYDDAFAPEAHRIASLAPGEAVTVDGELHLASAQMTPIEVQGRSLLIPLVAFKAISLDGDAMAQGAFIVGQESTPPGARMAPFRLDTGPRQFRTIGSRPAQGLIAA